MHYKKDEIILFAMTTFLSLSMALFMWPVVTTAMDQTDWPRALFPGLANSKSGGQAAAVAMTAPPAKPAEVSPTSTPAAGFGSGLSIPDGPLPGSPQALMAAKSAAEDRAKLRAEAQQSEESRELKNEVARLESEQARNQREKKYDSFVPTLDKLAKARAELAHKDSDAYLQTLILRYRSMEPALEPKATIVKNRAGHRVQGAEAFSAHDKGSQQTLDTVRGPEEFSPYTTMEPIEQR